MKISYIDLDVNPQTIGHDKSVGTLRPRCLTHPTACRSAAGENEKDGQKERIVAHFDWHQAYSCYRHTHRSLYAAYVS